MTGSHKRKLIEVALPLEAINKESAREKSIRHGHPSTLHLWWARRPLAACRAVIFASLVDDPSEHPDKFATEESQIKERERLFKIIEELVKWENSDNTAVLEAAKEAITTSTNGAAPTVLDPFCGGGSIPLEAQRLGTTAYGFDLNPVAVLICKSLVEIPNRFSGLSPISGKTAGPKIFASWKNSKGLAADIAYYGTKLAERSEKELKQLYPSPKQPANGTLIATLLCRTVICPNPACGKETPLTASFILSSRNGKFKYLVPKPVGNTFKFEISDSSPKDVKEPAKGLKRGMSGIFECVFCKTITTRDYVSEQGKSGRIGTAVKCGVVSEGKGRTFVEAEVLRNPDSLPDISLSGLDIELAPNPRDVWCRNFGLMKPTDLFTRRQLVTLARMADMVSEMREEIVADAKLAGMNDDDVSFEAGGAGARAYGEALSTYLGLAVSRITNTVCSLSIWSQTRDQTVNGFGRQAIPMTWDFCEVNPFAGAAGDLAETVKAISESVAQLPSGTDSKIFQKNALSNYGSLKGMFVTDPPYYDNIGYADLADFFYVWLRRSLAAVYPTLLGTIGTPKSEELVALAYRFDGNQSKAKEFFEEGLRQAFTQIKASQDPAYPFTLFYAFKQSESSSDDESEAAEISIASTGWEVFLDGLLKAGFAISGTWPMRTERTTGLKNSINALASSIILVCRPKLLNAGTISRREFIAELKKELPQAIRKLQQGHIAPVDLAQSAIGPGIGVFSRYNAVLESDGKPVTVRQALQMINRVLDEILSEQDSDYDADTRWAISWFEQHGFSEGLFGVAEVLSKAKDTGIDGLVQAGIVESRAGKVRLYKRTELSADWDPSVDKRLTIWEITHYLIRSLEEGGKVAAASLVQKVGAKAETALELAYRLYGLCERKKWPQEALAYNSLVVSWPEIKAVSYDSLNPKQLTTSDI